MVNPLNKKGQLIIISGPSGVGKGTICEIVLNKNTNLVKSVSVTTRKKRKGEIEGVNYFFRTLDEYNKIKENNGFLETFSIYGNFYGTPLNFVKENIEKGKSVLLEIDVQGAMEVKRKMPEAKLIFITPPSIEHLKQRLKKRNTEDENSYNKRIESAKQEIEQKDNYDYIVTNDTLNKATEDVIDIINKITK